MRILILVLALMLPMAPAQAEKVFEDLHKISSITVSTGDFVEGGCWPRPQATAQAVELVLRNAGITVHSLEEMTDDGHGLYIAATGGRGGVLCAVALHVGLSRWEPERLTDPRQGDPRFNQVSYGYRFWMVAGAQGDMQSKITERAVEMATTLANGILELRQQCEPFLKGEKNFFWAFPEWKCVNAGSSGS